MTDPEAAGDDQPPLFKTTSGLIVGTPSHLPPEAFDSVEPSEAFDLWALGVLLVESLLGRNPFQARSFEETYARIRSESFDPLKYLVNPSPALRDLLELSLSRNPHLRIPTAHEFLERLAAVH